MLLKREDWARERLVRHAGKTVRFALGGFSLSLTIGSDGLAELSDPAVVPDVTLTVSPESCRCRACPAVRRRTWPRPRIFPATRRWPRWWPTCPSSCAGIPTRWRAWWRHRRAAPGGRARRLAGGTLQAGQRAAENVSEYLAEESGLLLGRRWRNGAWTWPSWTRAPRRWRGPPPFCRRNWPPLAPSGAPDPCSPAAPATHHPGFPALRPGRAGAFQPEPPAGHLPAARHAAGHSSAPATRTAVAPGAGVAGPHLRQVRPGAVHPPRPDSGRYRQ